MHRHLRSTGLNELASDTLSETLPVEHVLLRNEAEGVGRVCFLLRNDRKSYRHQPQKQGKKSDFSAHLKFAANPFARTDLIVTRA